MDNNVNKEGTRREFIYLSTGAFAAVGVAVLAWPMVDHMNPSADVLALSSIEADISDIKKGQSKTVLWRGKPVFIRRRTDDEIAKAKADDGQTKDPAIDKERAKNPEWLIVVGVCTHLGCIPLGQKASSNKGDFGGWFCPCHGSHYDISGRIRKGPAPKNLEVPKYKFINDTTIKIG